MNFAQGRGGKPVLGRTLHFGGNWFCNGKSQAQYCNTGWNVDVSEGFIRSGSEFCDWLCLNDWLDCVLLKPELSLQGSSTSGGKLPTLPSHWALGGFSAYGVVKNAAQFYVRAIFKHLIGNTRVSRMSWGRVLLSDGELWKEPGCALPCRPSLSMAPAGLRSWHMSFRAASANHPLPWHTALPALGSLGVYLKIPSLSELTAGLLYRCLEFGLFLISAISLWCFLLGFFSSCSVVPGIRVSSLLMKMIIRGICHEKCAWTFKAVIQKKIFTVNSRLSVGALSESQIKCAMYIKRKQQKNNSFRGIMKYTA